MKTTVISFLTVLNVLSVIAQNDNVPSEKENPENENMTSEIVTDRPDATESSSTVPGKTLQIETGIVYENTNSTEYNFDNWQLGTTLLRYGVWDNFELRVGSSYQVTKGETKETSTDSTEHGFGPIMAGFKVFIVEEKGLRPEISILADITLRHIGSISYRPTFSYPTARLSASHTLTPNISFGYNAGFGYNGENADGFFIYSAVLGIGITSKISFFAETFGSFDHGNLPNHHIDGGFTYLIKNNLQLDISAGTGFDKTIDKSFISTGLSWRIPR